MITWLLNREENNAYMHFPGGNEEIVSLDENNRKLHSWTNLDDQRYVYLNQTCASLKGVICMTDSILNESFKF